MATKLKINSKECALCEICIDICPENSIIKNGFKIIIEDSCTKCMKCIDICPVGAVYYE